MNDDTNFIDNMYLSDRHRRNINVSSLSYVNNMSCMNIYIYKCCYE